MKIAIIEDHVGMHGILRMALSREGHEVVSFLDLPEQMPQRVDLVVFGLGEWSREMNRLMREHRIVVKFGGDLDVLLDQVQAHQAIVEDRAV